MWDRLSNPQSASGIQYLTPPVRYIETVLTALKLPVEHFRPVSPAKRRCPLGRVCAGLLHGTRGGDLAATHPAADILGPRPRPQPRPTPLLRP